MEPEALHPHGKARQVRLRDGGRRPPRRPGRPVAAKYRVVFEAPGRATKEVWLSGDLEGGWYIAGNFLVGGFLGWLVVDPLTGAMWNLKPSTLTARLDKSVSATQDGGLRVVLADQLPPELLAQATPLKPQS